MIIRPFPPSYFPLHSPHHAGVFDFAAANTNQSVAYGTSSVLLTIVRTFGTFGTATVSVLFSSGAQSQCNFAAGQRDCSLYMTIVRSDAVPDAAELSVAQIDSVTGGGVAGVRTVANVFALPMANRESCCGVVVVVVVQFRV